MFAIGLNYRAHAEESGFALPDEPLVFTRYVSSFTGAAAGAGTRMNLTGNTILTGGGSGIGRGLAERLTTGTRA